MSSQLQNIAPAPPPTNPQQMHTQPQMSQMAAPTTPSTGAHPSHPLMSPGGHPIQQMGQQVAATAQGQYQIIQSQIAGAQNAATAQYLAQQPQVATYNQHGQIVLQPANFAGMQIMQAAQQPGQQQYILAAASPQTAVPGQKPGQPQMIASSPQQPGTGKAIAPMSQGTSGYTITAPGMVSPATGSAGATQTYIMANPMGGQIMASGQQLAQIPSSMASHIKSEPGKSTHNQISGNQPSHGAPQASATPHQTPQQAQAVMLPPGMTYMQAAQQQQQGQAQTQAIFQNGQLFFRAPQAPQDGMMYSPQGQQISQQQMQIASPQQMPPGLTPGMQPIAIQSSASMKLPNASSLSMPMMAGKTPISRQPLLLPSTTTSTSKASYGFATTQLPNVPSLQQPSPKSKQKMSPRGSGNVGRPPGPKSALMKMASQPTPRLPGPPIIPNQPGSPRTLGPPILQTSSPIPPNNPNPPHSQPPILQPMNPLPPPPIVSAPAGGVYSSANSVNKNSILSRPPTLSSSIPVSQVNGTSKDINKLPILPTSMHNKLNDSDKLRNGGDNHISSKSNEPHGDGESNTPKAVVKPNVLTHVIDGHIIQESSIPFPLDPNSKFLITFSIIFLFRPQNFEYYYKSKFPKYCRII